VWVRQVSTRWSDIPGEAPARSRLGEDLAQATLHC
jgi:hypothetical protein